MTSDISPATLLFQVRQLMGNPPRRIGLWKSWRLRPKRPSWLSRDDDLQEVFRQSGRLLQEGTVVWGALVQANNLLFSPGLKDHPAMAVYSRDSVFDHQVQDLQTLSSQIFELKGTDPEDQALAAIAAEVTNELSRKMRVEIPKALTNGSDVVSNTIMVFRKHLPTRYLARGFFPLLIHPDTPAALIVPCCFWPPQLVQFWTSADDEDQD